MKLMTPAEMIELEVDAQLKQGQPEIPNTTSVLVSEVIRARRIEDIARQVNSCLCEFPDEPGACQEWVDALYDVIERNPRPCDDK